MPNPVVRVPSKKDYVVVLEKVRDLNHLYQLAQEKKSVTLIGGPKGWIGQRQPAAWAINWTGQMLYWLLPHMYIYEPKEKKRARRPAEDVQRPSAESQEKEG